MKKQSLFITGTDTDVGKTYISTQITQQLQSTNYNVKVRKPIESGCEVLADGSLHPADGTAHWEANNKNETLELVTPYRYIPAIAPNRAASLVGDNITCDMLKAACLNNIDADDLLMVEGAGGFYSPLCSDGLNADLASLLNLNVVLVVNDQLGCINHTLLTLEAIKSRGLNCVVIILNRSTEESNDTYNHQFEIQQLTDIPVVQCFADQILEDISELLISG